MDNPAFKGKWVHPEIDNPEYTADAEIYKYDSIGVLGLDLWQVGLLASAGPWLGQASATRLMCYINPHGTPPTDKIFTSVHKLYNSSFS